MHRPLRPLSVLFLAAAAACQPPEPGYRDEGFDNTSGQGSPVLRARVYYPATTAGPDAPLLPRRGGWPTVVFLHGFATLGSWYSPLGEHLARSGCIAVLLETAQFSAATQELDARAMWPALRDANTAPGFFQGALDPARMALCGHSMGGGSTWSVLATGNPGYRCGVALAGIDAPAALATVDTPVLLVHGQGDGIVPIRAAQDNFAAAAAFTGVAVLYELDATAQHTNVAGLFLASVADREVFARSAGLVVAFCRRFLDGDTRALDAVLGADARAEPRLQRLAASVQEPELWQQGDAAIGTSAALGLAGEPGAALLLTAGGLGSTPTPFGELRLALATLVVIGALPVGGDRYLRLPFDVPDDRTFLGVRVPFQALAGVARPAGGVWLGRAIEVEIVP